MKTSLHPWDSQHRILSWTFKPKSNFSFLKHCPEAIKYHSKPSIRQRASLFNIPVVRTSAQKCCLAFTTEGKMAQTVTRAADVYQPQIVFSYHGMTMSLYYKTLQFHILKCCLWVRSMHTLRMRTVISYIFFSFLANKHLCSVLWRNNQVENYFF